MKNIKAIRTRKLFGVPLWILAIIVGSLLVSSALLGLPGGQQTSEITVTGLEALITFDGAPLVNDLVIAADITAMTHGQYAEFSHTLESLDDSFSYQIQFTIDDSWFTTPEDPAYGLIYGVTDSLGNPVTSIILEPLESENVSFWWSTDKEMVSGTATTVITLSGNKIGWGGTFGIDGRFEINSNNPVFSDYTITQDSSVIYKWDSDPTDDFDDTTGWGITESDGVWSLKATPPDPGPTVDIFILDTVLDTTSTPYVTDLVIDCGLTWDIDSGDFRGAYGFFLFYQDADNHVYVWINDKSDQAGIDWVFDGSSYKSTIETSIGLPNPTATTIYPCVITCTTTDIVLKLDSVTLATLVL